ncbi:GntP family permease [Vagococcus fessus]|uniref:Gluconate permease n=1 Tax=Vagococcus fessus TaxID=120370 RepID=A0A430A855_9ENTE|nr:SLC13 family permease [Vagococcus fessus]RSU03257.1 gluconate permease [Vagococcus fessus]
MSHTTQVLVALGISLVVLIFLLIKTRLNPFLALLIGAVLTGVLGGMNPVDVAEAVKTGFGNTMASLGILIGFGVMIGKILEVSGAAKSMGNSFLKLMGEGREVIALVITGFLTSLAIFCIPAFLILFPLAKDISRRTGISINTLGIALAGGCLWSHELVPPATGPIGGAGIFNADIAQTMMWGFVFGLPMVIGVVIYSKWIGKKYYRYVGQDGVSFETDKSKVVRRKLDEEEIEEGPAAIFAIIPIIVPVLLILINAILGTLHYKGSLSPVIGFFGSPIIALGIGLLLAVYLLNRHVAKKEAIGIMDDGIASGSKILMLIGTGGALGNVVNQSGVGEVIANAVARTSLPAIMIPFIIATLIRAIQGSGTVAILTTASITAPIMQTLGVDPVQANMAACIGAMFFSYFNDGYFWTITESIGATQTKEQIMSWSVPTTICWAIGGIELLLVGMIF